MGRTCTEEDEEQTLLISHQNQDQEDEEEEDDDAHDDEEEALSLSDLPVSLSNEKVHSTKQSKSEEIDSGFEFEIGSSFRLGSDSCEPGQEMSTADELFSKGRILPFRHSVSLDDAVSNRLITRSESLESRRTRTRTEPDRKIKNNFIDYSQPSPNPQIRRSSSMTARVNQIRNPKSSSIWDFLRLGLVRTPEIELRTNARVSVSRNSSCSSTSTNSNSRSRNRRRSFLFADCKCSVATETIMPVKMSETEERRRRKKTAKKEEKTAVARKRTFEWLKELSQVGSVVVDHGRRSLA